MNFTQSISTCFEKYFDFNGRASRSEYWWFCVFAWLLSLGGTLMDSSIGENGGGMMYGIATLATAIPGLAAGARRLHDVDKSGWWQLLYITLIGIIPLVIWMATVGTKKKNSYGKPIKLKK
jgi:uncharacterized membrane protein YhaH (DUF805 family)